MKPFTALIVELGMSLSVEAVQLLVRILLS